MFPFLRFQEERIKKLISCKIHWAFINGIDFVGKYWRCEWRLSSWPGYFFNTLKHYFLFAGSEKVFLLFCQIPSILCNTHLPFQSLPNTQLSILQMPISVHCNESRAACWDKVFLLLGDLSVPVFPNIGENAQSSVQFTEFSCSQYFSNSIQSYYNPFVLKLTNKHRMVYS